MIFGLFEEIFYLFSVQRQSDKRKAKIIYTNMFTPFSMSCVLPKMQYGYNEINKAVPLVL